MTAVERWALRLARMGLVVIALVTFVTSFDAVAAVAAARGAVSPRLAWALPLALDGLIVVASAVAWLESLRGGRWHAFPVTLVAVAGGLSVAANVAHATGTDLLTRVLAAVPPVALLAAVELGAWQLRRDTHRTIGQPRPLGEQDCAPAEYANGARAIARQPGVLWERIAVEVARLDARPSQQAIADRLGVSRSRVQRAIAANRDAWDHLTTTE